MNIRVSEMVWVGRQSWKSGGANLVYGTHAIDGLLAADELHLALGYSGSRLIHVKFLDLLPSHPVTHISCCSGVLHGISQVSLPALFLQLLDRLDVPDVVIDGMILVTAHDL